MSDDPVKQTGENGIGKGKPGPGRPKGIPNKSTMLMKDAIAAVYADLQADEREKGDSENGNAHFLKWAKDNETEFYKLAAKLIPIQLAGDPENPLKHLHQIELIGVPAVQQ